MPNLEENADPDYPLSVNPIPGWRSGVLTAKADTDALTALLRYKFDNGFSAIAGFRAQRLKTDVTVPKAMGYEVQADPDTGFGYVVGVAWEKPEIAARVALTYNSKISHDLSQTESYNPVPGGTVPLGKVDAFKTESEVVLPQSINLDFQTGVAPKTLLFGSVRWADWPELVYAPEYYTSIVGKNLVDYKKAAFTYSLGLGYKFNDAFSGAVTLGHEPSNDLPTSNLGPTDGSWSVGLGGTYNVDKAKISGGVRYTEIGDAVTNTGGVFTDNSACSVGLQVTYALN